MQNMVSSQWVTKVDGSKSLREVLKRNKFYISMSGISFDFVQILKTNIQASHKAILREYIGLIGDLAQAVGPKIK